MFPEANGADGERIGEEEAAAVLFLHKDDELVNRAPRDLAIRHLHGHVQLTLVIDGLGDQFRRDCPSRARSVRFAFGRPGSCGVRNRVIGEFEERAIVGIEVAEYHV